MIRRSISILAAGLLAAGTLFATVGAASAGTKPAHRTTCSGGTLSSIFVTSGGTRFFAGVPNSVAAGSTVRLKPSANGTTTWCFTTISSGPNAGQVIITSLNGTSPQGVGLAMTTRDGSPGGNVTVTRNGSFASQRWILGSPSQNTVTIQNVKTGLSLRVRNSGPVMGQLVTTGAAATAWTIGIA